MRKFILLLTLSNRKTADGLLMSCFKPVAALVLSVQIARAEILEGRVVRISDGDTLILLDVSYHQQKIRLAGIDAPEKGQPFGNASKKALADLVFGRKVVAKCTKRDRYERNVCKILVDGLDANLEQIRKGFAWHYKKYEEEQSLADRTSYSEKQKIAQGARIGLWSDKNPQAPWDFRHQKNF